MSKYGRISTLLRLPLSDFKLQASHTAMLSKEHFTCCWEHGIINHMITRTYTCSIDCVILLFYFFSSLTDIDWCRRKCGHCPPLPCCLPCDLLWRCLQMATCPSSLQHVLTLESADVLLSLMESHISTGWHKCTVSNLLCPHTKWQQTILCSVLSHTGTNVVFFFKKENDLFGI